MAAPLRRVPVRRPATAGDYDGSELSLKGDGGPTCLSAPLLRG